MERLPLVKLPSPHPSWPDELRVAGVGVDLFDKSRLSVVFSRDLSTAEVRRVHEALKTIAGSPQKG